ncbi:increased DNA methylation 1-like [Bidens hawaiensis]|uniref:increased DNA methylation 1-like n=1 Tax=Bidens hawaiensis TaxID=980011 RepID=UPI00404A6E95
MQKGYRTRALRPMNTNPSKKGDIRRGSPNRKPKVDVHFERRNGGTSSPKSQKISTLRTTRLETRDTNERQQSGTILSWLIDSQNIPESATIYYIGPTSLTSIKKGTLEQNGILCACCKNIFTIRDFQMHSGGNVCDNPYDAIGVYGILDNNCVTPLSQYMQLALLNQNEPKHHTVKHITKGFDDDDDVYDDVCILCADGGNLICCEQCSSTFHVVPDEPYYCAYCACSLCGMPITKRDSSCLTCSLCGKQYHVKCSNESLKIDINHFPRAFCDKRCRKVHEKLENKIGVKRELEGGLSWTLLHRFDQEYGSYEVQASKKLECYSKLAVAFRILTACFELIKDRHTRIDMIRNVGMWSHYQRINFRGFFTGILEKGDEIIAVASIRVHGTNLAEIPFIATAEPHRNKGMCGKLLHEIESDLQDFGVGTIVIPSSSETVPVWKEKYGFNLLKEDIKQEIMKLNTLMFHDCLRMQKTISGYLNTLLS